VQITKHIHALKIPFQVTDPSGLKIPRFVYIYLIYGRKICLIDCGVASSSQIILDHLTEAGRSPKEISHLILTHAHPDHIGAAKALKNMSGCVVAAHAAEKAWIEDVDLQEAERPVPGFKSLVEGSVHVDVILQDGDEPDLGDGLDMQVIHTPGHSPGSISLWLPQEGALFSADAIPTAGGMPVYEDIRASARSIQRLKSVQGIKVLLSAWDDPRMGTEAYRIMDSGLDYLQRIHDAVIKVVDPDARLDSMELCRRVLEELGLPKVMANSLVARSFQASLSMLDQRDLLQDLS
jgi:hydroxyacylglutathione hydrolase